MIINPPHIVELLRAYRIIDKSPPVLASLFTKLLGPQSYSQFLKTYHLHLQSIPLNLAKEAWGLTQTTSLIPSGH